MQFTQRRGLTMSAPHLSVHLFVRLFVRLFVPVFVLLSVFTFVSFGPATTVSAAPCWQPPVSGQIRDPFREPPCPYCAGNRGLEYRIGTDETVRAVAAGRVTFSGVVAGTRYVVVELANGWKLTYGNLSDATVRRGHRVVRGAVLGRADRTFFFGLRIDGRYRDPEPFIGAVVGRPRLVPIDGTPRRPPPRPRLSCRT